MEDRIHLIQVECQGLPRRNSSDGKYRQNGWKSTPFFPCPFRLNLPQKAFLDDLGLRHTD